MAEHTALKHRDRFQDERLGTAAAGVQIFDFRAWVSFPAQSASCRAMGDGTLSPEQIRLVKPRTATDIKADSEPQSGLPAFFKAYDISPNSCSMFELPFILGFQAAKILAASSCKRQECFSNTVMTSR